MWLLRRLSLEGEIIRLMSKATAASAVFPSRSIRVFEAVMNVQSLVSTLGIERESSVSEMKYFQWPYHS